MLVSYTMQATLTLLEQPAGAALAASRSAALRLRAPADETRVPVHFIALIDVSESMSDNSKLKHVKHCLSLLVNFLTPVDEVSLITFGDDATVVLKRAAGTAANVGAIRAAIAGLHTDGCTNLSAGLAAVSSVLEDGGAGATATKPLLLVLTDGHANKGVTAAAQLRDMTVALERRAAGQQLQSSLSFSFVAYGTDHNAGLLQEMAAQHTTSYSIVNDMESAALTMGEALGGVSNCWAQNVVVRCPAGTVASGAYAADLNGAIKIGDIYAGAEICVLLDLPQVVATAAASATTTVEGEAAPASATVEGIALSSLEPFRLEATTETATEMPIGIQLARLQIRCSAVYEMLRREGPGAAVRTEFEALRAALAVTAFDGHPIAEMLRQELPSLEVAINAAAPSSAMLTQLAAHQQYVLLGRGTSQPIQMTPPPPPMWGGGWGGRGGGGMFYEGIDDNEEPANLSFTEAGLGPTETNPRAPAPRAPRVRGSYLSPVASSGARRVAAAMQELSQVAPDQ